MHSEATHISPVLVELRIEVPWERIRRDLDGAFSELQRSARIKGFRQGKTPRSVVRNVLGKQVKRKVTASLVREGLEVAVREHELHPVALPEIETPTIR